MFLSRSLRHSYGCLLVVAALLCSGASAGAQTASPLTYTPANRGPAPIPSPRAGLRKGYGTLLAQMRLDIPIRPFASVAIYLGGSRNASIRYPWTLPKN